MKRCPICQRTYADNAISFCLVDGSILSAPYDPEATQRIAESSKVDLPPTEVLHPAPHPSQSASPSLPLPTTASPSSSSSLSESEPDQRVSRKRSKKHLIVIGGAVVLITVVIVALSMTGWWRKPAPSDSTNQTSPTDTPVKVEKDSALRLLSSYKIGIYFPNNIPDLAKVANTIRDKLLQYGLKKEQIQLYSKDNSFFESAVPPNGYEIRYEPGYEDDAANNLDNILKEIYPAGHFQKEKVEAGRTENFISIFLGLESQK
jgi:hypothetical protein